MMEKSEDKSQGRLLPLAGHILFASIRQKRIDEGELQRNIQSLGGKLETFFSKEITCVLTDEFSVPSRQNKVLKRNLNGKILSYPAKQSNIVDKARSLGIQVMRIEKFLAWLKLHINVPLKTKDTQKALKSNKVTKLGGCFMKFESCSQNYSPMYKVYASEPDMEFERLFYQPVVVEDIPTVSASKSSSSFVNIKLPKVLKMGEIGSEESQKSDSSVSSSEPAKNDTTAKPKRHYCECCKMYFTCLEKHVKGPQHSKYIANSDNFKQLTALTNEIASVSEFRDKISTTPTSEIKVKTEQFDSGFDKSAGDSTEFEEKLLEILKCNDLLHSDSINEILKVESSAYDSNNLDGTFPTAYTCTQSKLPVNESFTDKVILKEEEEMNFNDLFPSDILLDNERLFSSDMSDNESIQQSVLNIIHNVFEEEAPSNNKNVLQEDSDSSTFRLSEILDHDLLNRTSGISDVLNNPDPSYKSLCLGSWSIRPVSDIKMIFVRCSLSVQHMDLEHVAKDLPCESWIVKNVDDTKLVLTRSRFSVDKTGA